MRVSIVRHRVGHKIDTEFIQISRNDVIGVSVFRRPSYFRRQIDAHSKYETDGIPRLVRFECSVE
jgi:hypothetical protein